MVEAADRRVIVLSVHPQYVHAILRAEKQVEFRRNRVPADIEQIVFYSTAPDQLVLGYASAERCVVAPPEQLWAEYGKRGAVSQDAFRRYFSGARRGKCFVLGQPRAFLNPIPILDIGLGKAPQSFAYLSQPVWKRLRKRKLTNKWVHGTQ